MNKSTADFPLKRLLVRLGIWLVLGTAILYGMVIWWCASEIAEPSRRSPQAGALPYLDGSAKAGFTVKSFTTSDGMPCLVCTPKLAASFSRPARTIRKQLAERGITPVAPGEILGTLLILHGRGGIKEDYLAVVERFSAVGFRCVVPDLPGHGGNPSRYATYGVLEATMVLKCFQEAAEKYGFPQVPSGVFGQSMGGSVAIHMAALEGSPFQSLVVVSSFDRMENVVRPQTEYMLGSFLGGLVLTPADRVFAWKTGVKFSEINPVEKAAQLNIPVMVVHGDGDTFVPFSAGKSLYAALPESIEKQWITVPGANHNNVLITDYPLYVTMAEWFLKHLPVGSPAASPR